MWHIERGRCLQRGCALRVRCIWQRAGLQELQKHIAMFIAAEDRQVQWPHAEWAGLGLAVEIQIKQGVKALQVM